MVRQLRYGAKKYRSDYLHNYVNKGLVAQLRTLFLITPLHKNVGPITHYATKQRAHYAITPSLGNREPEHTRKWQISFFENICNLVDP